MEAPEPSTTPVDNPPPEASRLRAFLARLWRRRPRWEPPWSWPMRAALLFVGVFLPILCFAEGFPMQPTWRTGGLQAYARMLLTLKLSSPLLPLLLYSMTCLVLLIFAPERFVKRFVVRFGVYSGVLMAVQYWVLFVVALGSGVHSSMAVVTLVATVVPLGVGWLGLWLFRRLGVVVAEGAAALILIAVVTMWPAVAFFCLLCATPWAVVCYGGMAVYAFGHSGVRRLQFSLAQLLGVTTWLAGFLGAWRTSVLWMLQEYARLPASPPPGECYVCTAAARGHRRLVGAEDCATASGRVYRANDQMRHLKAAELLLAAGWPRGHRACRRVYDRLGPRLAARLGHPLAADAAYLALKPAEWLARAVLATLVPGQRELIRSLYRPSALRTPA